MKKKHDKANSSVASLGRRDLLKIGGVAAVTTLAARNTWARRLDSDPGVTQAGWKNDSGRASGNGPMDSTTRLLVEHASSFSESKLTNPVVDALSKVMVDCIGCLIAGFESEPARVAARMARSTQSNLKSTVLGYGVTTSPELAAFANASMVRHADFNDVGWEAPYAGGHYSDMISGILAIAEALHSSGPQVLAAVTLGYEVMGALQIADFGGSAGWDTPYIAPAVALASGKLLGLNEDQLANALSLSLVPHNALYVTHVGALSMWKGCHSAAAVKSAVFAALLAREGMTGPCQPFEGRDGVWDRVSGPFKNKLRVPALPDGRMGVQTILFKRAPAEAAMQGILSVVPEIRAWTKVDEIASIQIELTPFSWLEIADPPKWDPRNRETADHSMPYVIAVALTDGEVYLDSYTPKRYLNDAALRLLMQKIIVRENRAFTGIQSRITVRKKTGAELSKYVSTISPMSHEEIIAKFKRICAFKSVSGETRDRALATWGNLRAVRDIAEPMHDLAHFGRPSPL